MSERPDVLQMSDEETEKEFEGFIKKTFFPTLNGAFFYKFEG